MTQKIFGGRKLLGIKIYSSKDIFRFKNKIDQILFAIPSLNKDKSMRIFRANKRTRNTCIKSSLYKRSNNW